MNIFNELKDFDYKIESLEKREDEFWLTVFKNEILKEEKLIRRNESFSNLASYYNSIYDGWDVGKID